VADKEFGLEVKAEKTKTMHMSSSSEFSTEKKVNLDNKSFQNVAKLKKYLEKSSNTSQLHCGRG
jgi:hypothetical protein